MIDFEKKATSSSKLSDSRFPLSDISMYPKGTSGIYRIVNNINGKCYIGQAVNIRTRLLYHRNGSKAKKESKIQLAIKKYGLDNFSVDILCIINILDRSNLSISKELNVVECMYIELFDSFIDGYNSTPGGDSGRLGFKHTKETIEKIREKNLNRLQSSAKLRMKKVFGYDVIDRVKYESDCAKEMTRKTGVHERSINHICNKFRGRFIAGKNRFIFSYSEDDLLERLDYFDSGMREKDKYELKSKIGRLNKGLKHKKNR